MLPFIARAEKGEQLALRDNAIAVRVDVTKSWLHGFFRSAHGHGEWRKLLERKRTVTVAIQVVKHLRQPRSVGRLARQRIRQHGVCQLPALVGLRSYKSRKYRGTLVQILKTQCPVYYYLKHYGALTF